MRCLSLFYDEETETWRLPRWLAPGLAGVCISAGWWVYIDAVMQQRVYGLVPEYDASWMLPGAMAMLGACMTAMTPAEVLHSHGTMESMVLMGSSQRLSCGRCWLFAAFMLSFGAIVAALMLWASMAATASPNTAVLTDAVFPESGPISRLLIKPDPGHPDGNAWAGVVASHSKTSTWPGQAAVLQTALIFAGSVAWISRRVWSLVAE